MSPFDPHAEFRPEIKEEDLFDPIRDQHTGIILGLAISARKTQLKNGELKDVYMVRPGDDANVMLTTIGNTPTPVIENCTIVDFYSSNMHEYDSNFAFMPISELQKLRGMVDPMTGDASVSTIQIKLKEGADLNAVRDKLIEVFPRKYYPELDIRTWQDTQRPLLSAVKMELTILNILLFLIIAVAGFGILATFYMIVVEKTKDIGILKALGAPSRGVMSIFLGYGMSLGTVGTGAGIILGLLFVRYINEIADLVAVVTGQEVFDPTIYYFSEIPTIINPITVIWVALGAIAIAVLASVLPALRAARLHPVEALRYE
jgi:lipoprotein-releasing system permease protein